MSQFSQFFLATLSLGPHDRLLDPPISTPPPTHTPPHPLNCRNETVIGDRFACLDAFVSSHECVKLLPLMVGDSFAAI